MKKVLSVALAVVMLFAVCVPAFAANPITDKTEQSGTTIVKTSTKTETGEDGRRYSVTIPANTTIPWGKASVDMAYVVEAHLAYGEHQGRLRLQYLRPRRLLPRSGLPGHLLHHGRSGHDRRHDVPDRQMGQTGETKCFPSTPAASAAP